ncbi:MAG: alpha/beta hydrolase fold domain-containing protein [Planctomycetia bacterium]
MHRGILVIVLVGLALAAETTPPGDPRPAADTPVGGVTDQEPRMSRRARRAARRRASLAESSADDEGAESPQRRVADPIVPSFAGEVVHRDQPYGSASLPCQRFDILLPEGCDGGLPLVVWIHGDSWRSGTKDDCPVTWLTRHGYAVASIGYRLSSEATFPAQVDDCLEALATIQRDAELWGIDRTRVCVAGAAAGGHLAALSGLWNQPDPDQPPTRVAAIATFAAPTHLTTLGPQHDRPASPASLLVGGPLPELREAAQRASPLTHVSSGAAPVLVVHGRCDTLVPPDQSVRVHAALEAAGVESRLVMVDGAGHDLSVSRTSPAGVALLEFLDRTLGRGRRSQ